MDLQLIEALILKGGSKLKGKEREQVSGVRRRGKGSERTRRKEEGREGKGGEAQWRGRRALREGKREV